MSESRTIMRHPIFLPPNMFLPKTATNAAIGNTTTRLRRIMFPPSPSNAG